MLDVLLAIVLTLITGVCDAFGFVHASRTWKGGQFSPREAILAVSLFLVGIVVYIALIRNLQRLGITSPEIQTLGWFATTVIGIAIIERSIVGWATTDKVMAAVAFVSVGWLVVRKG